MNYNTNYSQQLKGNSVTQVADEVGCDVTTVYKYLKGELGHRSRKKRDIMAFLGIDVDEIRHLPDWEDIAGCSVQELAKKSGYGVSTLQKWRKDTVDAENSIMKIAMVIIENVREN